MIDEAMAGSMPMRFKINGIDEPAIPAITRLPIMARNITTPSIGLASNNTANKNIISPMAAPLIKPTVNSLRTAR